MNVDWYRGQINPQGSFREVYVPMAAGIPPKTIASNTPAALPNAHDAPCTGLTILHVNDIHHFHLQANLPAALHSARLQSPATHDVIYVSAGDEYTGTTLDSLLGYTAEDFVAGPAYRIQTLLGLDAAAVGNHDLDRGPEILEKSIVKEAKFPVLSANIQNSSVLRSYAPAMIGVTVSGLRVGIIACTTPEELQVSPLLDASFQVTNPVKAVLQWYEEVHGHVEVVVVLSHLGLNTPGSRHTSKIDDYTLANALRQAQAGTTDTIAPPCCVIGGHTHTIIDPEAALFTAETVPIFQAGCNGKYLGVAEVSLITDNTPCTMWSGKLLPIHQSTPDMLQKPVSDKSWIGPAGWSSTIEYLFVESEKRTRHRVGSMRGNLRVGHRDVQNDRLTGECTLLNGFTDLLQKQLVHLVAPSEHDFFLIACDASGVQQGFEHGDTDPDETHDVTIADLYRIMPYADTIMIAVLSPQQLLQIVESNARRVLQRERLVDFGGDIEPMDWAKIARGFLHFSWELRYSIRLQKSGMSLCDDVRLAGKPLEELPEKTRIAVAVNSYTARGNQGWGREPEGAFVEFGGVSLPDMGFTDTGAPFRTAIIEGLRKGLEVDARFDGRILVTVEKTALATE